MASSNGISTLFTAVNTIAQRTTNASAGTPREWQLSAENRSLSSRNHRLQSRNTQLEQQQRDLQRKNQTLQQQVSELRDSVRKAHTSGGGPAGTHLNVYA